MKRYLQSFMTGEAASQFLKVATIGVVNTICFFVVFNILRRTTEMSRFWAITVAFALATMVSYVLNRKWTFDLKDGHVVFRETLTFYAVNVVAWAATEAIVALADEWFGPLSAVGENVALIFASGIILLPKFASYRDVVFRKAIRKQSGAATESDRGPASTGAQQATDSQ